MKKIRRVWLPVNECIFYVTRMQSCNTSANFYVIYQQEVTCFLLQFGIISIGNNMIPNAIWGKWARMDFSRTAKLYEPVGQVEFVVFEKFTRAYLFPIALEIMWLPALIKSIHQEH